MLTMEGMGTSLTQIEVGPNFCARTSREMSRTSAMPKKPPKSARQCCGRAEEPCTATAARFLKTEANGAGYWEFGSPTLNPVQYNQKVAGEMKTACRQGTRGFERLMLCPILLLSNVDMHANL